MFSMESGKYYSAVYKAKAFGFNISAGADTVRDATAIVTGTGHFMCSDAHQRLLTKRGLDCT
jgi:hypothetical protein